MSDQQSRFERMQKMQRMKTRYALLQSLQAEFEDMSDDEDDKTPQSAKISSSESTPTDSIHRASSALDLGGRASVRKVRKQSVWIGLKAAIVPDRRMSSVVSQKLKDKAHSPLKGRGASAPLELAAPEEEEAVEEAKRELPPEEEDTVLDKYWADYKFSLPPKPAMPVFLPPDPPKLEEELAAATEAEAIIIGKVPKAAINEQKELLKARLWNERDRSVKQMKAKEKDLLWREHLAKKRVEKFEGESRARLTAEKAKVEEAKLAREKLLGREFRRAREALEDSIKNQNGQLGEVFGHLDAHSQQSMARKMYIKSTALPQPVEFRVRFLRAVKSKLPKGAYLIMLTQFESLGGRPLAWTKLGTYGIGEDFPGATKAVKHYGRYFDRTMKFEDSCFALCPPATQLKPGFCFILELFQLKSRTNPADKQVAWTAVPMCNEEMNIVEGKLKLPLMRGAHTPSCAGYRNMEKAMGDDLDIWLCNIYLDIRTFSLSEMTLALESSDFYQDSIKAGGQLAIDAKKSKAQLTDLVRLNRYINLDFLNKRLNLQNGWGKYSRTFGQKEHEDDQAIKSNPSSLLRRKRFPGAKNEVLETGFEEEERLMTMKTVPSARNLKDYTSDDEAKRRALLMGGAHNVSFNHYKDGFGAVSTKDGYSRDSLQRGMWAPLQRAWAKSVAFFTGQTYIPSESDGVTQTRRYENPTIKSPSHYTRLSRKAAEVGGQIGDGIGSSDDDVETGKGSKSDKSVLSQIEMERKLHKKRKHREMRQAIRSATIDGENGRHVAIKTGDANSVFTTDVPDGNVIKHSFKRGKDTIVEGNDDHLDSDGFSSDGSEYSSSDDDIENTGKQRLEEDIFFTTEAGNDSRADVTVIERGLETEQSGVAKALHPEQTGKIVGIETVEGAQGRFYAASGLGRKVLRRLQSDGLRLDSEIMDNNDVSNTDFPEATVKSHIQSAKDGDSPVKLRRLWAPLDNRKDLELYDMSLCSDIAKRAHLLPSAIAACKIRFLMMEAFGDIMGHKLFSFEFYATILTLIFSFWLRIYVHFLAQFLYLGILSVPVFSFELAVLEVRYKYMSAGLTQANEILLLFIGPGACLFVFMVFAFGGYLFHKMAGGLPDGLSTFISSFGIMTILDPALVLIVDLINGNYNCPGSGAVCNDYTAPECTCFTGDWMKLWDRMESEDSGSGISGLLITMIIYFSLSVLSALFYHEYITRIHRNGHILDLWRRVHSTSEEFFMPDDFEVSRDELVHICTKANQWRGGGGDVRRVSITKLVEKDAADQDFLQVSKLYAIHEMHMDGSDKKLYRQFLLVPEGYITEVFADFRIHDNFVAATDKEKRLVLMENWNNEKDSKKKNETELTSAQRTKRGLFSGLERA